jgi:hypothetical protein
MMTFGTLGSLYPLAAPVMSLILLGMRGGVVTVALSAISMTLLCVTGYSYLPIQNAYPNSFGRAAIFTLNYACVSTFSTLTCGKLLKSLSASVDDQRSVAEALADRQAALHA